MYKITVFLYTCLVIRADALNNLLLHMYFSCCYLIEY